MRFATLAIVAGLSAMVSAQGLDDLPTCAQKCYEENTGDCSPLDIKCICGTKELIEGLSCCVKRTCDEASTERMLASQRVETTQSSFIAFSTGIFDWRSHSTKNCIAHRAWENRFMYTDCTAVTIQFAAKLCNANGVEVPTSPSCAASLASSTAAPTGSSTASASDEANSSAITSGASTAESASATASGAESAATGEATGSAAPTPTGGAAAMQPGLSFGVAVAGLLAAL